MRSSVSVLFNEPKLLKYVGGITVNAAPGSFSALQRAEIAEIELKHEHVFVGRFCFSALQRAEIAEIEIDYAHILPHPAVSVLFNEPKLLKSGHQQRDC